MHAHKAGDGCTSQGFKESRAGLKSIIKKFKESPTIQNMPSSGRKQKISKTLEIKLAIDVSKDFRTTAKTPVNELAKLGIVVSKKTITKNLQRNGLRGCRPGNTPLLQKRCQVC